MPRGGPLCCVRRPLRRRADRLGFVVDPVELERRSA